MEKLKVEIIKRELNGNIYTFICETWETSKAWGHRVTMFLNNYEHTTQKIIYQNRTWEKFKYQSCIHKCINQIIAEDSTLLIEGYKKEHHKQRITQQQKDDIINNSKIIQELRELKATL